MLILLTFMHKSACIVFSPANITLYFIYIERRESKDFNQIFQIYTYKKKLGITSYETKLFQGSVFKLIKKKY